MKGVIVHFRGGRHTQNDRQMILQVEGVDSKDKAAGLVGKQVVWAAPGKSKKKLTGKISAPHGNSGAVRAIFETGMPGQSLSGTVEIQ